MSETPPDPGCEIPDLAARAEAILDFWFSDTAREKWFDKDDGFDRRIRDSFLAEYERIAAGDLQGWPHTSDGLLALVILLDQFPRNMFRGEARAFAGDAAARAVADAAIERGFDEAMSTEKRRFLYMPFMHSEDPEDQQRCVDLLRQRGDDDVGVDFALRHQRIIERFGRFPHRNAVLDRDTTAEEAAFLTQPDSSF